MNNSITHLIKLEVFFIIRQIDLLIIPACFLLIILCKRSSDELLIGILVYSTPPFASQLAMRDYQNCNFPLLAERGLLFSIGLIKMLIKSTVVCFYSLIPILYIIIFHKHIFWGIAILLMIFCIQTILLCYSYAVAIFLFIKEIRGTNAWEGITMLIMYIIAGIFTAAVLLVWSIGNYPLWIRISVSTLISIIFVLSGFFSFYYTANKCQRPKLK